MQNKWDERYQDQDRWFYGEEPNDFLVAQADRIPSQGKILSVGEGEGRNAIFLLEKGYSVEAIDLSSVGLTKLSKRAQEKGLAERLQTEVADLTKFEFGQQRYDAVIAIWCHGDEAMRRHLLTKAAECLKPGGCLILEAYTPAQLHFKTGGPPDATMMYTADEIQTWLGDLRCELLQEIERDIYEGIGHRGRSAVVQCLAVQA